MKKLFFVAAIVLFATYGYTDTGRFVPYHVQGEKYEGYFISPSGNAPLVFIVHDWDGLTDYEVKRAHMLAQKGFAVFALDLFGAGVRPTETADKKRLTGSLYQDRGKMRALLEGGFSAAEKLGADTANAVAAGYCFGGSSVLEWARSGKDLKGFVSFHGGLKTPDGQNYAKTKGQVLVLHGSADTSVTMTDFAGLAEKLEAAGVQHEMITYSGAPHAFTVFGSSRYRKDADEKSWKRYVEFLNGVL